MIVAAHDTGGPILLVRLEVECFEAAVMDVLELGERVLNGLGG